MTPKNIISVSRMNETNLVLAYNPNFKGLIRAQWATTKRGKLMKKTWSNLKMHFAPSLFSQLQQHSPRLPSTSL